MQVVYFFCEPNAIHVPFFDFDNYLFKLISSTAGAIWDKAKREFTFKRDEQIPVDREKFKEVSKNVPVVWVEPEAPPEVYGFLDREWQKTAEELHARAKKAKQTRPRSTTTDENGLPLPEKFSGEWREKLETEMGARKFSHHTRQNYHYFNALLCRKTGKTAEEMEAKEITEFLHEMDKKGKYSAATMNIAISAFRFFYKNVYKKDITRERHRPRQDKRQPVVLSKQEVSRVFDTITNIKHKLLMMMVYASGLRVSEVVSLKRHDLDMDRMVLNITKGKGRKDRSTVLAKSIVETVKKYYQSYRYNEYKDGWLFPGQGNNEHITIRTAQHICEKALRLANIHKEASMHSLRHSFATHLLESGYDITYIQKLLGHSSILTTERYTHVAKRKILKIPSPLDSLNEPDD